MKVAVVSPYAVDRHGGVQRQASQLAAWLRCAGDDAYLVAPGEGEDVVSVGPAVELAVNAARAPLGLGADAWRRTRRAVAGADVVHVHEPFMPAVGVAALTAGRPVVATFHADPSPLLRALYRGASPLWRRLLGRGAAVAVSEVARSAVRPICDVEVVPNAIDVAGYDPTARPQPHRAVFVGRDDPRKGLDVILEAWPLVRARVAGAELVVMGTQRAHAPDGVRYLGPVDEERKRQELAAAAVLCAPNTRGESFGLIVAEGMAAGCAVVATALPAFAAVLGTTGTLVPRWDVEGFAAAVAGYLEDSDRCRRAGAEAAKRVRRFDLPAVGGRYRELYAAVQAA